MIEETAIRIAIVDDHPLIRIGLRGMLEHSGLNVKVVGEAGSSTDFFKILAGQTIDMVLLDIILPDESGVEIAKKLKSAFPAVKILILSAESDRHSISQLVEIGVDGFLNKSVLSSELCKAVEYIADGATYFGRDIASLINEIRIAKNYSTSFFTKRENEIIKMCANGMSGKEIASELEISIKTVEWHKNMIFSKLGISNSVELVHYAIKNGIIEI